MAAAADPRPLTPRTPGRGRRGAHPRALLLAPAGLSLLAGLDGGLVRLGVAAPVDSERLAGAHGPAMVLGFLGTLIALERAVALGRPWGYAAPVLLGLGGLGLLALPHPAGPLLLLDGAVALVAVYVALWRRQRDEATATQLLGAVLAGCTALLLLRLEVPATTPLMVGFLVLTIAAERVELARLAMPATAGPVLLGLGSLLTATLLAAVVAPGAGLRATGAVLLVLVAWLARNDVARRLVHARGLPRFSAAALLAGYAWLGLAALVWLAGGAPGDWPAYDAALHAVFLGFAMSMVLAHAPVILPAVVRRPLPYRAWMWAPLVLLHASLAVRVAGAALRDTAWRQAGGVAGVAALLLLVASALAATSTAGTRRAATRGTDRDPTPDASRSHR